MNVGFDHGRDPELVGERNRLFAVADQKAEAVRVAEGTRSIIDFYGSPEMYSFCVNNAQNAEREAKEARAKAEEFAKEHDLNLALNNLKV